jgi:predicted RecB family endonuclease
MTGSRDRKAAAIRMNRLKALGLLPGAADLVVVHEGRAYFLEVKRGPREKQTVNQELFEARAVECGAKYVVVRLASEVKDALTGWGIMS